YRGAGRPEAAYLLERLVDKAARQLGVDRVEIRRQNFIKPEQFPYQTPVALQYDTGDYHSTLDLALQSIDYSGYADRKTKSEADGRLAGIGFWRYFEAGGIAPRRSSAPSARAPRSTSAPTSASIRRAASPSSPARTATARDTRRPSRRSSTTSS